MDNYLQYVCVCNLHTDPSLTGHVKALPRAAVDPIQTFGTKLVSGEQLTYTAGWGVCEGVLQDTVGLAEGDLSN